jgi:hypothetical protein
MGIIRDGVTKGKCPVDMDWMLAGYAFLRWVSDASLFFFESEEQPHVKEVNEVRAARREQRTGGSRSVSWHGQQYLDM